MDLRQLRYLLSVAEELNFTRAAERCNVSQPPLSRAIRELESDIGAQLFERDKHHVELTEAGAALVDGARKILETLDQSVEQARRAARGLAGALTFGFGGSTTYSLLPGLVRNFRSSHPDVQLNFRAMSVLSQIDALRHNEIDIGIVRLPIFDEMIDTLFIHSEKVVVALPSGHRVLEKRGAVRIEALRTEQFVTYEPTRGFNMTADLHALCRLAGFDPMISYAAPSTEAVVGIVACGEGVAVVPASAARLRMRGVVFRPLVPPVLKPELAEVRFALAWRRDRPSAIARNFLETAARLSRSGQLN